MKSIPPRTYASELTDDEIILFDFLWEGDAAERFLYGEALGVHANTPYSHSIHDDQLCFWLQDLINRNLLCKRTGKKSEEIFSLTQRGFEMWESERLPDWFRYVNDSWCDEIFTVSAVSKQIGLQFIEAYRKCGSLVLPEEEPIYHVEFDVELVRWKVINEVRYWEFPVSLDDFLTTTTNWFEFIENRVWWRVAGEL
ncbi:hypothetical protein AGMMS50256_13030 [Betaproteobacteria bacterium]|nr:hypothetical protein AGMMS50256_13030 [Betaproteobacteria bacterium]